MSEVKRLEMDHKGLPFVDEKGSYVLWHDYAALQQQVNQLKEKVYQLSLGVTNDERGMPDFEVYVGHKVFDGENFTTTDLVELSVLIRQQEITRQLAIESNKMFDENKKMKQQFSQMAAENANFKYAIESHKNNFSVCEACGEENLCHNDDVCRALDEIPHTDAFLLNVQADGAKQCGIHLRYWYDYMVEGRADDFALSLRAQAEELQKGGV